MTERAAFIEAIAADPDDDTARLAFADWLDEHGEEDRAEFVRIASAIAARRRDEPWSGPLPDGVNELWERAHDLFELRGSFWLEPFYRALGADERGATPSPRWPRSLWQRWAGEPRRTAYHLDSFQGDTASIDGWGNGPVDAIGLQCGFVGFLRISFGSPFPVRDLSAAFGIEPVQRLAISFEPNVMQWARIDVPCLRRVRELGLVMPPTLTRNSATAFERLAGGGNWSGLETLSLWCPTTEQLVAPGEHITHLARSPLLSRLKALRATVGIADLPRLTCSASASNLRALELCGCDLPPEAGAVLAGASFRANLEELSLTLNHLGDDGAGALAAAPWPKLRSLDLGCNDLTDAGVRHLLPLASQLTDLSLTSSEITDAGALALADALESDRVNSLCLSYNPLSAEVAEALRARFGKRFHFRTKDDDRAAAY